MKLCLLQTIQCAQNEIRKKVYFIKKKQTKNTKKHTHKKKNKTVKIMLGDEARGEALMEKLRQLQLKIMQKALAAREYELEKKRMYGGGFSTKELPDVLEIHRLRDKLIALLKDIALDKKELGNRKEIIDNRKNMLSENESHMDQNILPYIHNVKRRQKNVLTNKLWEVNKTLDDTMKEIGVNGNDLQQFREDKIENKSIDWLKLDGEFVMAQFLVEHFADSATLELESDAFTVTTDYKNKGKYKDVMSMLYLYLCFYVLCPMSLCLCVFWCVSFGFCFGIFDWDFFFWKL